jgi:TolA-binding protein
VPTTNEPIATPTSPEPSPAHSIALAPPTQVADASIENLRPKVARRAPKAVTPLAKAKKDASTLDAEMALLDGARASLRAGRAGDALRTLDGYDTQFPSGLLVPEATVVRIEALVKSGDKAGALRLGERFLRTHPDSPLAARVRSLTNS